MSEWFEEEFGFVEGRSYAKNQANFCMDGDNLVCFAAPDKYKYQYVGKFTTPSVQELRDRLTATFDPKSSKIGGLRFAHYCDTDGVGEMILDPRNEGSVFQAASQFNVLEMVGPSVSPKEGITRYVYDHTQGPACALACPAGTVYRNYLCQNGQGQGAEQIDCLSDVGMVLNNTNSMYWTMRNGYAMPTTRKSMKLITRRLNDDPELCESVVGALRVGVHWETSVKIPFKHHVAQVYASACPVSYAGSTSSEDWEVFAKLILDGAYEATLAAAACLSVERGGKRVSCYLTLLGGGAFGNQPEWIRDAINRALELHKRSPLDVFLVHYGSRVPRIYSSIVCPNTKAYSSSTNASRSSSSSSSSSKSKSKSPTRSPTKQNRSQSPFKSNKKALVKDTKGTAAAEEEE